MKKTIPTGSLLPGELASLTGVSADSLRHYEKKGVLPRPLRSTSGYRRYSPDSVERVRLIRRALAVGFTLDELAEIFRARDKGDVPCHRVRELAATKLSDVETRLQELIEMRNELRSIIKDWDARLSELPAGRQGRLLEVLASKESASGSSNNRRNIKLKRKRIL